MPILVAALLLALPSLASAQEQSFSDLGFDLEGRDNAEVEVSGYFRSRGEIYYNLDLNRGPTPSGDHLFPRPLSDPDANRLHHGDMRLRTDLRAYSPVGAAAVNLRVDVLDNLSFGSMPDGPPQTTASQRPVEAMRVRRAYGEALTPVGLLTVGRQGSHWGLGILTHGGDELDSDSGDAADRIAFITPLLGHIWAVAYDVTWSGPHTPRRNGGRTIDADPADNVRAVTVAMLQYRTDESIRRRLKAGRSTLDYGAFFSFRWQDQDVPAHYLPASTGDLDSSDVMYRGFRAHAVDVWARWILPVAHIEAEVAMLQARIDQASLVPGAQFTEPIESLQFGGALKSEVHGGGWPVAFGIDTGFATGDDAPGFGAFPGPFDDPGQPGDLDGPQANPPDDNRVDNFRFHPDFRIDQILFREIIGTVTDAVYLRPHLRWTIADWGPGRVTASLATVASWAMKASSTPGQRRPLGLEFNPSLRYESFGTFTLALDHALLIPFAGLDNPGLGISAQPAQALRLRIAMGF